MSKYDDPVLYYQQQVEQWQSELEQEESGSEYRAACLQLRNEAAALNAQFQRIVYAFLVQGPGLTLKSRHNYCVILEDATEPGRFRYQSFNQTGFIGHATRDTTDEVLLEAFRDGYREIDTSGALERFVRTAEWEKGSLINDLVRRVNVGELSHEQANTLYEAGVAKIASAECGTAPSVH